MAGMTDPTPAEDQARAALAEYDEDLYASDDDAARAMHTALRALLAERQEPTPSGMTREALAELQKALDQTDRVWRKTSRRDRNMSALGEAARSLLVACPAVGQEPAAVRPLHQCVAAEHVADNSCGLEVAVRPFDRVTDEMVEAASRSWSPRADQWRTFARPMRAALEAALARRPEGRDALQEDNDDANLREHTERIQAAFEGREVLP